MKITYYSHGELITVSFIEGPITITEDEPKPEFCECEEECQGQAYICEGLYRNCHTGETYYLD